MTKSPIWYGFGGFVGRLIIYFQIACMCLIWFNVDLFSWIFVLTMFFSLWDVMTRTLLRFPFSCWLDISYRKCWTVVGYFLTMLRIQTLVMFLYGEAWFLVILSVEWDIYDILWCPQYCAMVPIGLPPDGKLTWT